METVIDFRSFNPAYATGLIFSIFEGLNQGESFRLITRENPHHIKCQFEQAKLDVFEWNVKKTADDGSAWEVRIVKNRL